MSGGNYFREKSYSEGAIFRGGGGAAIILEDNFPGGNYPGGNHPGGNYPGGNYSRGQFSRGSCPRTPPVVTHHTVRQILYKNDFRTVKYSI